MSDAKFLIDRCLTLKEVATHLGVSTRTVYRLIADQVLPKPVKVRSASRIRESDVRRYLERIAREGGR